MNPLDTYLALQAATQGRAIQSKEYRHVHLSENPLVVAGYHLAGDVGAPLAIVWGRLTDNLPNIVVVPEPRDRALRFEAIEFFGSNFIEYLDEFAHAGAESYGRDGEIIFCDAPQIVVPNAATAEWLFGIVGRFTRNLRTEGEHPAPALVPICGGHLSYFHNPLPGSSKVLPLTETLAHHWKSGQLPSEDLNLHALLGWIDPPVGLDGRQAAKLGERRPPAGPMSDPNWDADVLQKVVRDWHGAKSEISGRLRVKSDLTEGIRDQLIPTWNACLAACSLLASLPTARSVVDRWRADRIAWTRHYHRVIAGIARFKNIPDPLQSAATLARFESATDDLESSMAADDSLVMGGHVAKGDALFGDVVAVDARRRVLVGTRRSQRPLISLAPLLPFQRPVGTTLFLSSTPSVKVEVISIEPGVVHAQVNSGANTAKTIGRLPAAGDRVVLSSTGSADFYPNPKIESVPWTHRDAGDQQ